MLKRKQVKKAKKKAKPVSAAKRHALWELAFGSPGAWKHGKAIYEELKVEKRKAGKDGNAKQAKNAPKALKPKTPKAPKAAKPLKAPKKKKALRAA